jgi:hypothetical protein
MLMCTECLMRRRVASFERDGKEPPADYRITDGLPKPCPAETVIQGQALCYPHLVECVQIQRQSALAAPNGAPLLLPPRKD